MSFVFRRRQKAEPCLNADGKLTVKGADEVVFYITADTDYKPNFDPDFKEPKTYVGVNPEENNQGMDE